MERAGCMRDSGTGFSLSRNICHSELLKSWLRQRKGTKPSAVKAKNGLEPRLGLGTMPTGVRPGCGAEMYSVLYSMQCKSANSRGLDMCRIGARSVSWLFREVPHRVFVNTKPGIISNHLPQLPTNDPAVFFPPYYSTKYIQSQK